MIGIPILFAKKRRRSLMKGMEQLWVLVSISGEILNRKIIVTVNRKVSNNWNISNVKMMELVTLGPIEFPPLGRDTMLKNPAKSTMPMVRLSMLPTFQKWKWLLMQRRKSPKWDNNPKILLGNAKKKEIKMQLCYQMLKTLWTKLLKPNNQNRVSTADSIKKTN